MLLLLWTRLTTLTKWTHLLTTNKLTKNLNATRRQHFNVNLTAKYLRLKRLTLLTLNATIDCGAQYHNHRNFIYGLPKLHKPGIPMRPIVSFCGSPTYQLSRYLTTILQPLTDKSRRKLQSTENFIDAIKTVQIPDDYRFMSFDVKSLFTSIPLQLALQCTEIAVQQSTVKLPLPTEDIMDLLNLCLTSTYSQYKGKHYKQLHGTAMGSPVSVVVAEIVTQHVEERALATCRQTIPLWLCYVDTFTAVHKDEIDDFHDHLNEQNADIQFTKEIQENGKLPFLDCLVSLDNNELRTTVYRKPTSHKATTIRTQRRRAQLVCDTPDSLRDENRYLERVFHKNN